MNIKIINYVKKHDIVNRVYNMLEFYELIDESFHKKTLRNSIEKKILTDIEFVETLASFFYKKSKNKNNNIDLQINIIKLINDLDYLKQYLDN